MNGAASPQASGDAANPSSGQAPVAGVPSILRVVPALGLAASQPRWAVSDHGKRPVVARDLSEMGELRGASCHKEGDMCTLDQLEAWLPQAPNAALYLKSNEDGVVVLDVEPKADAETKRRALELPWLYAERSLSGAGYHLAIPAEAVTPLVDRYPYAQRRVIKAADGSWELHFEHWVTFTGDSISPEEVDGFGTRSVEEFLEPTFKAQRPPAGFGMQAHAVEDPRESVPGFEAFVSASVAYMRTWLKDESDYGGDRSRLDFAACVRIAGHLVRMGALDTLDTDQLRCVVEAAALAWLEERCLGRPKLHEMRGDLTYLGLTAHNAIEAVLSDEQRAKGAAFRLPDMPNDSDAWAAAFWLRGLGLDDEHMAACGRRLTEVYGIDFETPAELACSVERPSCDGVSARARAAARRAAAAGEAMPRSVRKAVERAVRRTAHEVVARANVALVAADGILQSWAECDETAAACGWDLARSRGAIERMLASMRIDWRYDDSLKS